MLLLFALFRRKLFISWDYEFFYNSLYPLINNDKIVHDPFFDKIDFPQPRNGTEFIGDVFDENNNRHPDYYKYIRWIL